MNPALLWLVAIAAGAAATSALVVRAVVPVLRRHRVLDIPAHRSLHEVPTPRGAGLGILVAVVVLPCVGLAVAVGRGTGPAPGLVIGPVVAVVLLGLVGFADDLVPVPVRSRLVAQAAVGLFLGAVLVSVTGRSIAWVPFVLVTTLVLVNVTNFMDGADGLVSAHAVVTATWYTVVAVHTGGGAEALIAVAVLGGAVGFLPLNAPVARAFLGDVGSYTLGTVWAVLAASLLMQGAAPDVVIAPLLVPLVDAGVTLVRRLVAGDGILTAHRLHVYQRLVGGGWTHLRVTGVVSAVTLVTSLLAVPALLGAPLLVRGVAFALSMAVCAGYPVLPSRVGEHARWRAVRESMMP